MTQDSTSENPLDPRSRRGGKPLLSNAKGESRKRRRAILVVATFAACVAAWHVSPYWRMHRLIQEVRQYHDASGRYPASKEDVESLRGTAVRYETDKAGSGFALSFGHLCLYDLGDLRHFEYESWDDTWFSHAD
jgi:hypothetical protein